MQMHKIMQENYEWEIIALYYFSKYSRPIGGSYSVYLSCGLIHKALFHHVKIFNIPTVCAICFTQEQKLSD